MNHRLRIASVVCQLGLLSFGAAPLRADLVHYWRLDEEGGLQARDAITGAMSALNGFELDDETQWAEGVFTGALDLGVDASLDNYVSVSLDSVSAGTNGGYTISLWVNPGEALLNAGEYQLVSTPGDTVGLTIYNASAEGVLHERVLLFWDGNLPNLTVGTTTLEPGEWYHLAVTSTGAGGEKILYVNGEPETSVLLVPSQGGTGVGTSDGWATGVGGIGGINGPNRVHDSIIDDVRIYDEVLSADDILALVEVEPPRFMDYLPEHRQTTHDPADGFAFEVETFGGATIAAEDISVVLNGVDVSGDLMVSGTETRRVVSYDGLVVDTLYTAELQATDSVGTIARERHIFATSVGGGGDESLIHHFAFDEQRGRFALDVAGAALGTLVNFANDDDSQWVEGQIDGALDLGADGVSNNSVEFEIQGVSALDTGGFTIAMWIRPGAEIASGGEYQLLETPGGAVGFTIMNGTFGGIAAERVLLFWDGLYANITVTEQQLDPGTWYHVALTSEGIGGARAFYINGELADQRLLDPTAGGLEEGVSDGWLAGTARIGAVNAAGGRGHGSVVDDVRIYDRPLDESEIAELIPNSPLEITGLVPTPGDTFHDPAAGVAFNVRTPNVGATIAPEDIEVILNDVDVSAELTIGGSETQRDVSYSGLVADTLYDAVLRAVDSNGGRVEMVFAFGTYEASVEPGLVHHFKLDDTSGLTTIDLAGGAVGDLLNFENDDDAQWIDGVIDGALDLGADATPNNDVRFSVAPVSAAATGGYTIAMWVNPGEMVRNPGEYQLLNLPGDAVGVTIMNGTFEGVLHERVLLHWDGNAAEILVSQTQLEPGTWHHVAVTSTGAGGEKVIYVDGEPEEPILLNPSQGGAGIGVADGWAGGQSFLGGWGAFAQRTHDSALDDVRIYDIALDEDQVNDLANPDIEPPDDQFRRGDPDNSGGGNITDAIAVLNHLFAGTEQPVCWEAADANDDGAVNVADPVYHLNFLFGGGPPPGPPGPDDCGVDPDPAGSLGCAEYTSC